MTRTSPSMRPRTARCASSRRAAIATVELVQRLEETCGRARIPKLVIRGNAAPLDHPQLLECVTRHEVVDLVIEADLR